VNDGGSRPSEADLIELAVKQPSLAKLSKNLRRRPAVRPPAERNSVIPKRSQERNLRVPSGPNTVLAIGDTLDAVLREPNWQRIAQPSYQNVATSHV
jgi:hypothetical protein